MGTTHASSALDPEQEWELVMRSAGEGLERGADLSVLQADTALKIEAAEHAYKRLVADCAKLCRTSAVPPAVGIVPQPVRAPVEAPGEPEKAAEEPPLAA
jgi:hypothetical protein